VPRSAKDLQIDRDVFLQTLQKKLADLPPLPKVVHRIMQTVNDPNTSAEDLNRLISLDQGLASRILRIVNSAYYGFPKRISTVTNAVVILGFNTVRNLVLGVSAFAMLPPKAPGAIGLDRTLFWEHCVAVAVGSSIIARKRRLKTRAAIEEAFLGGLLHDIGQLFMDCYFPVPYAVSMAYAQKQSVPIVEAETLVLHIDHASVGRKIAEHWNFPASLCECVGSHHRPDPNLEHAEMASTVHAANWLGWQSGVGSIQLETAPELDPVVAEWLGFSEEDWAWATRELAMQMDNARDMFHLDRAA
jgi:putative nucleotidyltransferase with HDIG domain